MRSTALFDIISVDSRDAVALEPLEPLGTKSKFWYTDSDTRTLFKAEERGTRENWAE